MLRSALAVPVEGSSGVVAVLALYRADQDAFSKEDLQVVETIVSRLGGSPPADSDTQSRGATAAPISPPSRILFRLHWREETIQDVD